LPFSIVTDNRKISGQYPLARVVETPGAFVQANRIVKYVGLCPTADAIDAVEIDHIQINPFG